MLPVPGLKYNLVLAQSGKLVHPRGGSDNPRYNTHLVFHKDPSRLALEFIFENGQIKQYSSGKYIHPLGGRVKGETILCLHPGYDGARTGIKMVVRGDRTYLYHAGSNYYVHPKGGRSNPGDDTPLVYHPTYRPGISIICVPAGGKCKVTGIDFDTSSLETTPADTIQARTTVTNNLNYEQEMNATLSYARTVTSSFTFSFTEKLSFSVESTTEIQAGWFNSSLTFKFGIEVGSTQTEATTNSVEVKSSVTVKPIVKPNSSINIFLNVTRKQGDVPFTMHYEAPNGVKFQKSGVMKTEYFFDQTVIYSPA